MKTSEQTAEISAALAKAQAEMSNPTFDSQNPHFRNQFASLAAVRNAVVPVLAKHGLSIHQDLTNVDAGLASTLRINHASGQWMEFGPLVMPVSKMDAQGVGSSATYCRRYQLMSVCAVVGDSDDDAEVAVGRGETRPDPSPKAREYAKRFHEAFEIGLDQAVIDLHGELKSDEELYRATWGILPSGMRRQVKELVERSKQ